jgi:hypothetical protein
MPAAGLFVVVERCAGARRAGRVRRESVTLGAEVSHFYERVRAWTAKAAQTEGATWSIGPFGSLESRTAMVVGMLRATSTHS